MKLDLVIDTKEGRVVGIRVLGLGRKTNVVSVHASTARHLGRPVERLDVWFTRGPELWYGTKYGNGQLTARETSRVPKHLEGRV